MLCFGFYMSVSMQLKAALEDASQARSALAQQLQKLKELQQEFHDKSVQQEQEIERLKSQSTLLRAACGLCKSSEDNSPAAANSKAGHTEFVVVRSSLQHLASHLSQRRFVTAGTQTRRKTALSIAIQASISDKSNATVLLSEQTQLIQLYQRDLSAMERQAMQHKEATVAVMQRITQRTVPSTVKSAFMTWRCQLLRRTIAQVERRLHKCETDLTDAASSGHERITCYVTRRMANLKSQIQKMAMLCWQLGILRQVGTLCPSRP
jgi:hypothetical protein